jgi:hypothetical protein|tara:strand:- start:249 stop:350 length:102 start_codon:yes stop_codon:yes gene_type:complete
MAIRKLCQPVFSEKNKEHERTAKNAGAEKSVAK